MRSFADLDVMIGRVPAEVVMHLRTIDTGRGSEALYRNQLPALLTELANRARVESITASSAIEGVVVADAERASKIIDGKAKVLRNDRAPLLRAERRMPISGSRRVYSPTLNCSLASTISATEPLAETV